MKTTVSVEIECDGRFCGNCEHRTFIISGCYLVGNTICKLFKTKKSKPRILSFNNNVGKWKRLPICLAGGDYPLSEVSNESITRRYLPSRACGGGGVGTC